MATMGTIYAGTPMQVKTRKELLALIKPHQQKFLREDNGDLPEGWRPCQRQRLDVQPQASTVMA